MPPGSAPTRRRKRPRSHHEESPPPRARRPPPPPPPPPALVQLLRRDPTVLAYFESLQASLGADVQIWQDRAHAWQRDNERLRARADGKNKTKKNGTTTKKTKPAGRTTQTATTRTEKQPASRRKKKDSSESSQAAATADDAKRSAESDVAAADARLVDLAKLQAESVPIDDSMLDLLFSDEEDEDDKRDHASSSSSSSEEEDDAAPSGKQKVGSKNGSTAVDDAALWIEDRSEIFLFLKEAHDILTDLGIATVVQEEPPPPEEEAAASVSSPPSAAAAAAAPDEKGPAEGGTEGNAAATVDEKGPAEGSTVGNAAAAVGRGGGDADPPPAQTAAAVKITGRRSDESIVTDILDRIRSNTLIPTVAGNGNDNDDNDKKDFNLVDPNELQPCCNPPSSSEDTNNGDNNNGRHHHPLLEGKRWLLRALILLDTFCSPLLTRHEWDSYFVEQLPTAAAAATVKAIQIGLRGRRTVVDRLLGYLDGAVSERWAWYDRSVRLTSAIVHYYDDNYDIFVNNGRSSGEEAQQQQLSSCSGRLRGEATTNCSWLWNLAGRSTLAQLTTGLHLLRHQHDKAVRNVLEYVCSTAPALTVESGDHPRLPPVMSFVVLEGLLLLPDAEWQKQYLDDTKENGCWFGSSAQRLACGGADPLARQLLQQSVALAAHCVACIWRTRLASQDERIHDVATVELAAYNRLLKSQEWMRVVGDQCSSDSLFNAIDLREKVRHLVNRIFEGDERSQAVPAGEPRSRDDGWFDYALQIALVLHGDIKVINSIVHEALQQIDDPSWSHFQNERLRRNLVTLSKVSRHLVLRQLDTHQRKIGVLNDDAAQMMDLSILFRLLQSKSRTNNMKQSRLVRISLLCTFLQCSEILADGNTALRVVHQLIPVEEDNDDPRLVLEAIRLASAIPVVRVINLERRTDRMKAFMSQAAREQVLVVKGVASFEACQRSKDDGDDDFIADGFECGNYAFDGKGRLVDANQHLVDCIGSPERLDSVVATHWRPNDLKAFDRDAPALEYLVRMTPTERACALSHVGSWKGVLRSLKLPSNSTATPVAPVDSNTPSLYPYHMLRSFKISGFAEGPALLPKNDNLPPAPVCVILEDDAILVDRFVEKLADLLKELPRDFHFCSLGYSRPKSAPIIPYGSKIGIPSMLWYLTGYCISDAGARFLLDSLPVTGPVDSWIGLKMTSNWDNIFGERVGVGAHAKQHSELPAHKDLCKIFQFRAFCALQPLCSQKVGVGATVASAGTVFAASTGPNWRQRDTDIEYSGGVRAVMEQVRRR